MVLSVYRNSHRNTRNKFIHFALDDKNFIIAALVYIVKKGKASYDSPIKREHTKITTRKDAIYVLLQRKL